jgi:cellulose synthase/poly-beta-1,6-N-acetylglucosamine synthase-like glycosyltransferase
VKTLVTLACSAMAVALLLAWPAGLLILVAASFGVQLLVMGLQLIVSRFPIEPAERKRDFGEQPFVSIHVPTHNEPPEIVFQTLESLARLKWTNYEVLVIDNNTSDPALWRPLEEYCKRLGSRFRFFHIENLPGYKAGAMNYVRQFMNPLAEFIFVVDADYVVKRHAIKIALSHFVDPRIGLIQFPQNYRNVTAQNAGIALDYKHFFAGFMNVANLLDCVPSTGTLALVNVKALEAIGGFNTGVITEDADLGLRLSLEGFRSIYVNKVIGSGLMPHELDGLKKQRWRWTFGNAQILRRNFAKLLFSPALNLRQRLGFIAHLTAWFSFNLIPSLALIVISFYSLWAELGVAHVYAVLMAGFNLVAYVMLKYGIMHYSLKRDGHGVGEIWKAFASNMGLGWVLSASWLRCFFVSDAPFVRTNKFVSAVVPSALKCTLVELFLAVALLGAALILALTDFVFGPIAAALMCGARFAIYWVWLQTRHTLTATKALFPEQQPETLVAETCAANLRS